jgi:hypothetical protein
MRKEHHVVYNSERGGWDVKKNNSKRASIHCDTKEQAVDAGCRFSGSQKTELVIHKMNGKIQNLDSHGNDPFPPKDRK